MTSVITACEATFQPSANDSRRRTSKQTRALLLPTTCLPQLLASSFSHSELFLVKHSHPLDC